RRGRQRHERRHRLRRDRRLCDQHGRVRRVVLDHVDRGPGDDKRRHRWRDTVMYRTLGIHQDKGTTCVIDYYQRLALGAAGYSGSSLQSYTFEREDFSTGKKTLSIPVDQITPQELSKTMTATRNSDHVWDLTKSATPAQLAFSNTCDNTKSLSNNGVKITV